MNITEFLEARIAEDEERAETCRELGWFPAPKYGVTTFSHVRVLAECAAKRAIISECRQSTLSDLDGGEDDQPAPMWVARALAAVYADHPDYQQEWSG